MEKVRISKEIADAIEEIRKIGDAELVADHAIDSQGWKRNKCLNGMDLDLLIRALYIGYEVEGVND